MAVIQYTKKIASLKDYAVENGLNVDQNALEVGQGKHNFFLRDNQLVFSLQEGTICTSS